MNVLSLFDGMSCGQIALNRSKIKYNQYYASEIDSKAIRIAQKNYPGTIQLGDVLTIKAKDLPKIDLLIGGSPCQGFSNAGQGLNFDDPRSKLFFEFVRLLKECKPKYFLLENVYMKKEWQDVISMHLNCNPIMINSALVSAQNRKRLYWTHIPNITQPQDKSIFIKDILQHPSVVESKYDLSKQALIKLSKYKKAHIPTGKTPTLTTELAHSTGYNFYPVFLKETGLKRRLTPIEVERLQTVPDDYTAGVADTHRYRMLGNGWTVDVIAHIFKNIVC